jgi:exonuclease III
VKVATFNINNINKRLDNLLAWLAKAEPDVVSLQELRPEEWRWSSCRFYLLFLDEAGLVKVNEGWLKISFRDRVA